MSSVLVVLAIIIDIINISINIIIVITMTVCRNVDILSNCCKRILLL